MKKKINKKILIILVGFILLAAGFSYAVYAAGVVFLGGSAAKTAVSSTEKGLVGHWVLDGDNYNVSTGRVTDKTPYEKHGTNNGAILTTDKNGQANGAMSFNGVNNYISISYANPVKQTSVVAWFKSSGAPAGGYHIVTGGSNAEISINTSGQIRTGIVTNTMGRQVFNSGSGLVDGGWHQVAFTYDGANLRSFIDGSQTATNPVSGDLVGTAGEIGRYLSNAYVANGSISDVRIYNRALSVNEISSLFSSYKPKVMAGSLQQGLVFDMPLTSNYTKTVTAGSEIMTDRTPYSRDGQNYGATVGSDSTSFDGTDYIEIPAGTVELGSGDFAISAWAYFGSSAYSWQRIFGKKGVAAAAAGYSIYYGGDTGKLMWSTADGTTAMERWTVNSFSTGAWHHIVMVRNSSDSKVGYFFVDGIRYELSSVPSVLNTNSSSEKPYIGGRATSLPFNGSISGVKIYNRALSATEVKSLYDKGR
jgi:hypothetical protein